jgi:hypothetical protein
MATTLREVLDDCEAKERVCNVYGCSGDDGLQRLVARGTTRKEPLRMEIMVGHPSIR